MNILIFGASGKTGHELVKQALAQGHNVTAVIHGWGFCSKTGAGSFWLRTPID